jgi:CheY-like chemotaxis protein
MARAPSVAQTDRPFRPLTTAARRLAVAGRSCASCGSPAIRPSNRRNALDILLACLFLAPFRCKVCHDRFYRVWRPSLQRPSEPPSAPFLVAPPRRTLLNLESMESPHLTADPIPPQDNAPQLVPVPEVHAISSLPVESPIESPVESLVESNDASEREFSPPRLARPTSGPILIFESDLSIRKLLRRLLERRGYLTVEVAEAGDIGRELRDRRAHLLIVDVSAPQIGIHAVVELARAYPKLKILALSAEKLAESEMPRGLLALPKPFPLDRFVDCVDRLLEEPGSQASR